MMESTEADERLPTSRRLAHDASSAPGARSRLFSIASSTLGPPLWKMKLQISFTVRSLSARNSSTLERRYLFTRSGISEDSTTLKPLSLNFHPTRCSVPGYSVDRVSSTRGHGRSAPARASGVSLPANTTAAAPSPNRPDATRLPMDSSLSCHVSEQ